MSFVKIYPLYIDKAGKKGRAKAEVDEVIFSLTGCGFCSLQRQIDVGADREAFFANAPQMNPNAALIKGVVCGRRAEDIEDEIMRKIRLYKLVDELSKGKEREKYCENSLEERRNLCEQQPCV